MRVQNASIDKLKLLIDKGQFKNAKVFAEQIIQSKSPICSNAEFWFMYGVVVRLTRHDKELLADIGQKMIDCNNYSPLISGDWLRDDILLAIRRHDLEGVDTLILELRRLHQDDTNRLAAITMVQGRIAYAKKDYDVALSHFIEAEKAWRELRTNANNQWMENNLFAMYKVMVALKNGNRYPIANEIINKDKSRTRRLRTRFIKLTGRLGNTIDDILMQIRFA